MNPSDNNSGYPSEAVKSAGSTASYDNAQEIYFADIVAIVWSRRWLCTSITLSFAVMAIAYSMISEKWYRAEVLLMPAQSSSSDLLGATQFSGLGGLMGLAGVNIASENTTEAIAVMTSGDFIQSFIMENNLITTILFEEWDEEADSWKQEDPNKQPDVRDAIAYFTENILRVSQDAQTQLVTLTINWIDAHDSVRWAHAIIEKLNYDMRTRTQQESQQNVAYLEDQLSRTKLAALHQSVAKLLEAELQRGMMAKGNEQFAFRIIDHAQVPRKPHKPKTLLIMAAAIVLGIGFSLAAVFVMHQWSRRNES